MIYSFFSATLPALSFSLFFTFDVPLLRISPQYTMYSPSFHLIPFLPPPASSFFLSVSLSRSFSFARYSVCVSSPSCATMRADVCFEAVERPREPTWTSTFFVCIAVSLDLHDPHESPRDSLPTSELRRWTKEESKTIQRYTNTWMQFSIFYVDINNSKDTS